MKEAVKTLLECIGEDPAREGLVDTPQRVANALLFLTSGYETSGVGKCLHFCCNIRRAEDCSIQRGSQERHRYCQGNPFI